VSRRLVLGFLLLGALVACGKKGVLELPEEEPAAAPPPAGPPEDEEILRDEE
jgi:predicted small lipoprotein YifL